MYHFVQNWRSCAFAQSSNLHINHLFHKRTFAVQRHKINIRYKQCWRKTFLFTALSVIACSQSCLVSTQFPIFNCSVSNILRTTENLEIVNWVETQNCLVLSQLFSHRRHGQDKTSCLVRVGGVNKLLLKDSVLV